MRFRRRREATAIDLLQARRKIVSATDDLLTTHRARRTLIQDYLAYMVVVLGNVSSEKAGRLTREEVKGFLLKKPSAHWIEEPTMDYQIAKAKHFIVLYESELTPRLLVEAPDVPMYFIATGGKPFSEQTFRVRISLKMRDIDPLLVRSLGAFVRKAKLTDS